MEITTEFLKKKNACKEGVIWFKAQDETDAIRVLEALVADDKLSWANWLIVRVMTYEQYVSYAIFAAEQVVGIYEKKYPDDLRPRKAIEAAKICLKDPSDKNKKAACAAADAAYAAYAAYAAADAAYAAAYAAAHAAADAAYAAYAAGVEMKIKILKYGIELLKEGNHVHDPL